MADGVETAIRAPLGFVANRRSVLHLTYSHSLSNRSLRWVGFGLQHNNSPELEIVRLQYQNHRHRLKP